MKRILFSLILCCFAICGFAQTTQEHLSFKGVPITGSLTSFCQKLQQKGLTKIGTQDNITIFRGDFTGRQATIGAVAADNGKDVFSVAVMFDESEEWNTLVNTYEYYKEIYTEKYGAPTQCVENNPSFVDSNTALMAEVYQGRVTYASLFESTGGKIQISIEKGQGVYTGFVLIKYQDAQNVEAKRQSDIDEI